MVNDFQTSKYQTTVEMCIRDRGKLFYFDPLVSAQTEAGGFLFAFFTLFFVFDCFHFKKVYHR